MKQKCFLTRNMFPSKQRDSLNLEMTENIRNRKELSSVVAQYQNLDQQMGLSLQSHFDTIFKNVIYSHGSNNK